MPKKKQKKLTVEQSVATDLEIIVADLMEAVGDNDTPIRSYTDETLLNAVTIIADIVMSRIGSAANEVEMPAPLAEAIIDSFNEQFKQLIHHYVFEFEKFAEYGKQVSEKVDEWPDEIGGKDAKE